jgi:hypothetical protein
VNINEQARRRAIIEAARATLARTADIANAPSHEPSPPHDDPLDRWATGMPKPEEPPRPRKLDRAPVPPAWVEQRAQELWHGLHQALGEAIANEREFTFAVIAQFVAEMRDELIDEINQAYSRQFNIVKLDIDALRHEIRKYAGAGVLELPQFLGERSRAN